MNLTQVPALTALAVELAKLRDRSEAARREAERLRAQGYPVIPNSGLKQMVSVFALRASHLASALAANDTPEMERLVVLIDDDFRNVAEQDFSWSTELEGGALLLRPRGIVSSLLFGFRNRPAPKE